MKSSISSSSESRRKTPSVSSIKPIGKVKVETISWLGVWMLKLIAATLRWEVDASFQTRWDTVGSSPTIFIFWHDRQLMLFPVFFRTGRHTQTKGLCALASRHADGRIIARCLERIGFKTVSGSSNRGGAVALHALSRNILDGFDVAITPDGPRGPRYTLKDGAIKLAQMTGASILPISYSAEHRWSFKTWDRLFLPMPFSRAYAKAGDLISIPREMSDDIFRRKVREVEAALKLITEECDRHEFGA